MLDLALCLLFTTYGLLDNCHDIVDKLFRHDIVDKRSLTIE